MTYSRPGIGQVSTQVAIQAPNKPQVTSVGGVSGGPVMPYREPVGGGVGMQSVLSTSAQAFLGGFLEPAQKEIAAWQERERQEAAANFITANPSFTAEGMRTLTDEQRGVLNRFDRRTQEILLEQRVQQAALRYATDFAQAVQSSETFVQPEDPLADPIAGEARRGAELLRLKQQAQASVGFAELPGFAQIAVLERTAQAEQTAIGEARGIRMAEERVLQKQQDRRFLGTTMEIGQAMGAQAAAQVPPLSDDEVAMTMPPLSTAQAIPIQQAGAPSAMVFPANAVSGPVAAATPTTLPPPPSDEEMGLPPIGPPARKPLSLQAIRGEDFIDRGDPLSTMLSRIRSGEGSWISANRGTVGSATTIPGLDRMTVREARAFYNQGFNTLGAFQFIPSTFPIAQKAAGVGDGEIYSPATQTRMALGLILGGKARPVLTDYLYGRSDDLNAAAKALSQEWAAVRGPSGKGAYDNDAAGNRASVSVMDLLPQVREQVMGGQVSQSLAAVPQLQVRERRQLALISEGQARDAVVPFDQELGRRLKSGSTPRELASDIAWNLNDQLQKIDSMGLDPYEANQRKMAMLGNFQRMLSQSGVEWGGNTFLDIPDERGVTVREAIRNGSILLSRAMESDADGLAGDVFTPEAWQQLMMNPVPFDQRPQWRANLYQQLRTRFSHRQAMALVAETDKVMDRTASDVGSGVNDVLVRDFPELYEMDYFMPGEQEAIRQRALNAIRSGRLPASALPSIMQQLGSRNTFTPEAFGQAQVFEKDPSKSPLAQLINEEADQFLRDRADALQTGAIGARPEIPREQVPARMREFIAKRYTALVAEEAGKGKPIGPEQASQLLQRATEEGISNFRKQELGPAPQTGLQRFNSAINTVQQNLIKNGGQLTLDVFPKLYVDQTRKRLGRQNVTPSEVGDTFMNGARLQRDADGALAFPNGRRANGGTKPLLRELIDNARTSRPALERNSALRGWQPPPKQGKQSSAAPAAADTYGSVGSEIEELVAYAPVQAEAVETSPTTAQAPPPEAPTPEQVVIGAALGEALGVQLIERRQDDQLLAFDPMGVMRRVINGTAVREFTELMQGRQRVGPSTPPLPQMKANAPLPAMPTQVNSETHPAAIAIGIAEGTRRADGTKTQAWYGHEDPNVPGRINIGTYSSNAQDFSSPAAADAYWNKRLTMKSVESARLLQARGLKPTSVGWHRMMFNILDLEIQAPAANRMDGFLGKLDEISRGNYTVEAIAKARADSYINPATGRLETTFASYDALLADQRRRAGAYDYKGKIR